MTTVLSLSHPNINVSYNQNAIVTRPSFAFQCAQANSLEKLSTVFLNDMKS